MTFIAFEFYAMATVLPVVAADLGATRWYSLAYAASATTGLIGMIVGGSWADRRGITVPLAVGGLLFVTGLALCTLAPDMATFVAGRLVKGFGGGIDSVLIYVIVARYVPEAARPRMFGLLVAAWLLPSLLGPVVGGAMVDQIGWRAVFGIVFVGAVACIATLLWLTRVPAAAPPGGQPVFGRRGWYAFLAAAAILVLHLGGQQAQPWATIWLAAGLVLLGAMAARLLPAGTFAGLPGVPRLVGLRGLLGAVMIATDAYIPLYLQHYRGFTPTAAGLVIAIGAVGWVIGSWLQGRRGSTQRDSDALIATAALLVAFGPAGALLFVAGVIPVAVLVAACVLMGMGMGMAYPRITSAVLALSPAGEQGVNSSAIQAAENMASTAFLAITGAVLAVLAATEGFVVVYALIIVAAGLAVVRGRLPNADPTRQGIGGGPPA